MYLTIALVLYTGICFTNIYTGILAHKFTWKDLLYAPDIISFASTLAVICLVGLFPWGFWIGLGFFLHEFIVQLVRVQEVKLRIKLKILEPAVLNEVLRGLWVLPIYLLILLIAKCQF